MNIQRYNLWSLAKQCCSEHWGKAIIIFFPFRKRSIKVSKFYYSEGNGRFTRLSHFYTIFLHLNTVMCRNVEIVLWVVETGTSEEPFSFNQQDSYTF